MKTTKISQIRGNEELIVKIEEIFECKGFKCLVVFNELKVSKNKMETNREVKKYLKDFEKIRKGGFQTKWRCGYVGVTKKHPLYKKNYNQVENLISVHGGLTFSNFGDGKVLPKDKNWYFGFDCHHYQDTPKIWTFKKVKKEVKELAEQLVLNNLILTKLT